MRTRSNPLTFLLAVLALTSLSCSLVTRALEPGAEATPTSAATAVQVVSPTPAPTSAPADENEETPTEKPPATPTALPAETATAPLISGDVFRYEQGGYAFEQVAGWNLETVADFTVMVAPDGDQDQGPAVFLMSEAQDAAMTLSELYDQYASEMDDGDTVLSAPIDVQIGGVPARRVDISGTDDDGQEMAGSFVVAMIAPQRSFLMLGMAPQDRWEPEGRPAFDAVLATLVFFEPESSPAETEPTERPAVSGELVRSWATTAEATSAYGSVDWSAGQAAGAPNTLTCGDYGSAWASAEADGVESITLYYYDAPLVPSEINIVQSYNPSQVVKVEVLDPSGEFETVVYEGEPEAVNECPYTLSIPVDDVDYAVMGIRITVDQSVLGLGWNEIDAVELVGYPEAGGEPKPPSSASEDDPSSSGDGLDAWEDVKALPVYPSASTVTYTEDIGLTYMVNGGDRQEVLDFLYEELDQLGWLLDVDEDGNCRNEDNCMSKFMNLDYDAPDNMMWFFVHTDALDAALTLTLVESNGIVVVSMSLVP
ncbi:MAG: hypothetical protein ACOYYS_20365 [Chloroflexota bacterium]